VEWERDRVREANKGGEEEGGMEGETNLSFKICFKNKIRMHDSLPL